jgi:hypothetical protein
MSKYERILERIRRGEGSVTYQDLHHVLIKLGYIEKKTGKTSGSRVAFYHQKLNHIIRLHKPHPGNELREYQKKYIKSILEELKLI